MVRKRGLFKVVGHGDGPSARKGIALALKKQEGRLVVSVEKQSTQYQKELRSRGVHTKPGNLVVLERTDSVDFLAKQAAHTEIQKQNTNFRTRFKSKKNLQKSVLKCVNK